MFLGSDVDRLVCLLKRVVVVGETLAELVVFLIVIKNDLLKPLEHVEGDNNNK